MVWRASRLIVPLLCLAATMIPWSSPKAASVNGSAILRAISTDDQGVETDRLQQNYNVSAFQNFTPYLSGRLSANYVNWDQRIEDFSTELRRFQPSFDLGYTRDRLTAKLTYLANISSGSFASQDFRADTLLANVDWRPVRGPAFVFGYRHQRNVADASVFGRDTRGDYFTFQTYYGRNWGILRYNLDYNDLTNKSNGTDIEQLRHQFSANWSKPLRDNRLNVGVTSRLSRVDQNAQLSSSTPVSEPLAPREGLFAIDTAPEIGTLASEPRLIDGNVSVPIPEIEIGGANTFRNIGVDMGITRPVSQLQIAVDAPSDSGVVWQVYQSDDNLLWQPITGVRSFFDVDLFRYTIVFSETTNRFFKAVNVSPNSAPLVFVTEIRALVERADLSGGSEYETSSNLIRVDGFASYHANTRLTFDGNLGFNNDQSFADGFIKRSHKEIHFQAGLNYMVTRALRYDFSVRLFDIDDSGGLALTRTERIIDGGFLWTPRPTVEAVLRVSRRDELSDGTLLSRTNSIRMATGLDLLPDLRFTADVTLLGIEQPGTMYDRDGYNWRVQFMTRPATRWSLDFGYGNNVIRRPGGEVILDRDEIFTRTTWAATRFLNFSASWMTGRQVGFDTIYTMLGMSYTPGPKLSLTASYTDNRTEDTIEMQTRNSTGGRGLTLTYRLNRHTVLFASARESRTEVESLVATDMVTSRLELRIFF